MAKIVQAVFKPGGKARIPLLDPKQETYLLHIEGHAKGNILCTFTCEKVNGAILVEALGFENGAYNDEKDKFYLNENIPMMFGSLLGGEDGMMADYDGTHITFSLAEKKDSTAS